FFVEAVDEAAEVAGVEQAVFAGEAGERAVEVLTVGGPGLAGLRNVAALRRVDAVQMSKAFTVLRVLADAEEYVVIPDQRRRDDVALGALAAEDVFRVRRVHVEFPQRIALERLEGVDEAIATGEDDLRLAGHDPVGRR